MAPRTTRKPAAATKATASTKRTRAALGTSRKATVAQTKQANNNGTTRTGNRAASKAILNQTGLPKLGKGGLGAAVLDYMAGHPKEDFSPSQVGKALTRSGGACANAMEKFAEQGLVTETNERPRRYRYAGAKAAKRANAVRR
ncbi:MAG: hypothetical protein QOF60_1943 [Actinomycetota bacterium]|jgi:hypothetical protein|nr:hypothetical protein [Actinomycetota bacterium]